MTNWTAHDPRFAGGACPCDAKEYVEVSNSRKEHVNRGYAQDFFWGHGGDTEHPIWFWRKVAAPVNPTQQKLTNAYNERVAAFCGSHGESARDESYERAEWCKALGRSVAELFIKFRLDTDNTDFVLESIPDIQPEEAYLVACAVAVALEEVK